MKGRDDWKPPFVGFVVMIGVIALLAAYCVRVGPDQPPAPTPTAAPVATMTSPPAPTVTASIVGPVTRRPTQTPASTSTPVPRSP